MINVIESTQTKPMRFLIESGVTLEIGNVVMLKTIEGTPVVTLCDGSRPFGIVMTLNEFYGMAGILFEAAIVRTDYFDESCEYYTGDSLYCNRDGKLSTIQLTESSQQVGYVIFGPMGDEGLQFNWI